MLSDKNRDELDPDMVELWIVDRYGPITCDSVDGTLISIHAAAVTVMGGIHIGMGPTRRAAIHDLYEVLHSGPEGYCTCLSGFWRERRDRKGERRC